MMRIAYILFALALASPAWAQDAGPLLRTCPSGPNPNWCEISQKDFKEWYPKAYARDYQGQRNAAFCLSTGCDGSVERNDLEGCAWRMVILGSGSPRIDSTDRMAYATYCGANRLSNAQRADALRIAESLFKRLYRKDLPLERVIRP